MSFSLHHQLTADCHILGRFEICQLLLHQDAALPWFILVPETDCDNVLSLEPKILDIVMRECQRVNCFVIDQLGYKKTNFAAIGNLVPQLHLHVVGRRETDPCWPAPVWGNLNSASRYSESQLLNYQSNLARVCHLQLNEI